MCKHCMNPLSFKNALHMNSTHFGLKKKQVNKTIFKDFLSVASAWSWNELKRDACKCIFDYISKPKALSRDWALHKS